MAGCQPLLPLPAFTESKSLQWPTAIGDDAERAKAWAEEIAALFNNSGYDYGHFGEST